MPQSVLSKYLELFEQGECHQSPKQIGIGMDSAVIPLRDNLNLVQSVDYFYPLIDNPYLMGKIALANVVSDIYATGVTIIDKLEMIISAPTEFTDAQRDIVVPLIIQGFKDSAQLANCEVSIQSITINPWCIIGGIATSVCLEPEIIFPNGAEPGDVLILTKPLGTQLATNAFIWLTEKSNEWEKLESSGMTSNEIEKTFQKAVESMTLLNKTGAELMHKYKAHAATDVTGFGLKGHAENLAKFQIENVDLEIHTLPIISGAKRIAEILGRTQKLFGGLAVETSGGLLLAIPGENAQKFMEEYEILTGFRAWIVGQVVEGTKTAKMVENVKIIDV